MSSESLSRRRFIQAAGSAAVWVPSSVRGYSPADLAAMAPDGELRADVSKWELDTPALCVDLDALEANLAALQETVSRNGIASRPHAKTHKCPAIARLQLASGSVGICTAKVGEAEVMLEHGIEQRASLFRIAIGEQLHGAFEIGEQHRHLLALAFERGLRGQDLLRNMARGVRFRRAEAARSVGQIGRAHV